jgi:hypothetical protein
MLTRTGVMRPIAFSKVFSRPLAHGFLTGLEAFR